MDAAALRDFCLEQAGSDESFPFGPHTAVFKVGGKIFALAPLDQPPLTVSVKGNPELLESLRSDYPSIVPGYHLNKRHWVTITLNADAPDALVRDLIEDSHDLVR
ncbi:MAG: MmcQ/YjbR family DNA-binding protein [Thermoleophilia bacterium]|nr:MmcQ/YjbR family DNA-binding protein [Thermoleophilia bacterium]